MESALLALLLCAGIVHGRITYLGRAPAPRKLIVTKDPQVCGATRDEEIFIIGKDGGVKEVVVYLSGDNLGDPPDPTTITLDQKGCRYLPHVQIAPLHSTVRVRTSDPILHNVHSFLNGSTVINFAMPPSKSLVLSKTLDKAGGEQLKCDIHSFMTGGIFVSKTKYAALTSDDGTYEIRGVPAGTWTIATWHQSAGAIAGQVTVTDGATTQFDGRIR
jgi:hypothetical protein